MFDPDWEDEVDPIVLIRHNAKRGAINSVPPEKRIDYLMEFNIIDGSTESHYSVEFQAKDDRHASNKANLLLRLGVEGTDFTWDELEIFRVGTGKIADRGQCTCPDEDPNYCPTHGLFLVTSVNIARSEGQ